MERESIFEFIKSIFVQRDICKDMEKSGTGFMLSLSEGIRKQQKRGYTANLVPKFDHLEVDSGEIKLYPKDMIVEKMYRFENTSDPDDQSILYAISAPRHNIKGLYIESYGTYHDELSKEMLEKLKDHPH